jgi:transcriptional regulator NrdR family protein
MNILVSKRDGSIEPFIPEKIKKVVRAAGLDETQANTLVANVLRWAQAHDDQTITSLVIRDRVLHELKHIDDYSANMFAWYQKTKE